jgi:hypothetical protein
MRKTIGSRAKIGIVVMSLVVSAAFAQSAPRAQEPTPETQTLDRSIHQADVGGERQR